MDGQLDTHFISMLESKQEKTRFVRVDSDIVERLIVKSDSKSADLTPEQVDIMSTLFRVSVPSVEKAEFIVQFEALSPDAAPAMVTQNEFMRRMKDMSAANPGIGFYGELPDSYALVVNTEHPAVKELVKLATDALGSQVAPIRAEIEENNKLVADTRKELDGKKDDKEASETLRAKIDEAEKKVTDLRAREEKLEKDYAATQPKLRQVADLALLAAGLLSGEALAAFVKRSASML